MSSCLGGKKFFLNEEVEKMNSHERVLAALQLKEPDRVPFMDFAIALSENLKVNVSEKLHSRQIKDYFVSKNELRDKNMPKYISDTV